MIVRGCCSASIAWSSSANSFGKMKKIGCLIVGLLLRVVLQAKGDEMFDARVDAMGMWRLPVGNGEMLDLPWADPPRRVSA